MPPQVTVAGYPMEAPSVVYFPLVFCFYILCEELQDLVLCGWHVYIVQAGAGTHAECMVWLNILLAGWLNLMDMAAWMLLLLVWVFEQVYMGVIPRVVPKQLRGDVWWSVAVVQVAPSARLDIYHIRNH